MEFSYTWFRPSTIGFWLESQNKFIRQNGFVRFLSVYAGVHDVYAGLGCISVTFIYPPHVFQLLLAVCLYAYFFRTHFAVSHFRIWFSDCCLIAFSLRFFCFFIFCFGFSILVSVRMRQNGKNGTFIVYCARTVEYKESSMHFDEATPVQCMQGPMCILTELEKLKLRVLALIRCDTVAESNITLPAYVRKPSDKLKWSFVSAWAYGHATAIAIAVIHRKHNTVRKQKHSDI